MDPADWAAKLEDRFYNNHAFQDTAVLNQSHNFHHTYKSFFCLSIRVFTITPSFPQQPSPEKEPATEVTISK